METSKELSDRIKASMAEGSWIRRMFEGDNSQSAAQKFDDSIEATPNPLAKSRDSMSG